jgi:hypothetical protein
LPWALVASALSSSRVDAEAAARAAVAEGRAVAVLLGDARAMALTEHVVAEQGVADAVGELVESQRLRVVVGMPPRYGDGAGVGVLADAHLLGSAELAHWLDDAVATDVAEVVIAGDPDALGPFAPGQPFRDLLNALGQSGPELVRVTSDEASAVPLLRAAVDAVRRGEPPTIPADQHDLVRVGARDDADLAHRVEQVVTDSLPRVLSLSGADVGVVTPMRWGPAGAETLRDRLGEAGDVVLLHDLRAQRWPAVVAVLPAGAAGVLDRPSLVSLLACARAQLTIAHVEGLPLAQALTLPHRRRVTILPTLLAQFLPPPDGTGGADSAGGADSSGRANSADRAGGEGQNRPHTRGQEVS